MKLAQIRGQDQPIGILSRAVGQKRVAHAYLFCGPSGVGKKTTALSLAQALNCRQQTGDACMECPSCRKIEQGQHPDVRLIKPDGQYIKIEAIRHLQQELACKPYEGRVKTQIIDEAERLTPGAANCLLKMLEEPPSDSLLILISAHPYNLLATILSRCQRLAFGQLGIEVVEGLLKDRGLSPDRCKLVAFFCQGSIAEALELDIEALLAEREGFMKDIIGQLPLSVGDMLDQADKLASDKQQAERLLRWLLLWYRDMLFIHQGGKQDRLVNEDKWLELNQQAARFSSAELSQKLYTIEDTSRRLQRHINSQLALEVMFMDLNSGNNYETTAY